jgi:hypothetical protein
MSDAELAAEIELYANRRGFEADTKKVEPLKSAIARSHRMLLGAEPNPAPIPASSMWRDINCFDEMRIPSLAYGPGVSSVAANTP